MFLLVINTVFKIEYSNVKCSCFNNTSLWNWIGPELGGACSAYSACMLEKLEHIQNLACVMCYMKNVLVSQGSLHNLDNRYPTGSTISAYFTRVNKSSLV